MFNQTQSWGTTYSAVPVITNERIPEPKQELRELAVMHLINGEYFSGAERVQQLLGKRLPEFGVKPTFVCLKPNKFPGLSDLPSETIRLAPMRGRFDFGIVRAIEQMLQDGKYDLLHAHTPRAAMVAAMVARRNDIPWIYHVHSPTVRDSTRALFNGVNDWAERLSLLNCSKLITVSKSLRREMLSRGWARSRVVAVGNGVAIQSPISPETRMNEPTWRLGVVALFRPRKGLEVLLEALSLLPDEMRIELEVIGGFESPGYERLIHRRVEELNIASRVHFRGFTKDVISATRRFDAMVLPSLFGEGMPMVVLEALSCGIPVIATKVEGTPEVIREGQEGVLAEPQNSASLATAIARMTASRSNWAKMSRNAFNRHRSQFTDTHMAESVAKVYRRMLP